MKKFIETIIIFLLPNLFWQTLALFLDVNRVIVNFDYLAILLLLIFRKKNIGLIAFLL